MSGVKDNSSVMSSSAFDVVKIGIGNGSNYPLCRHNRYTVNCAVLLLLLEERERER